MKTETAKAKEIKADIVYLDDNGSNDLPETPLPWVKTVQIESIPTISLRAGSGDGTVHMSIAVEDKVVCQQSSDSGAACEYALRPG